MIGKELNQQDKARRFPCPSCGADMTFEPKDGTLTCPYCGHKEQIPLSMEQVQERSYEQYLNPLASRMGTLMEGALEVQCSGCGSVITFPPNEVAGECPFCGAKIVAQPHTADPLVTPEGVLPFYVPQKEANASIRKWISTRWFAPNALKKLAQQEGIQGVYLPFWTYDSYTVSHYTGQRGEHYWETEYYTETGPDGKTEQKSRQVRKTRWYHASGTVSRWFDDILIPATQSLPRQRLDALEPWDLPSIVSYEPSFLSGFKAQRYQVQLDQGFEAAKQIMEGVIDSDVRSDIGGDEQRVHEIRTAYSGITFKHLLLPVWISAYRFQGKVYQVMVNARTGEVQGDRPYSFWKIAALVLLILVVILGIYFFSQAQQSSGYNPTYPAPYSTPAPTSDTDVWQPGQPANRQPSQSQKPKTTSKENKPKPKPKPQKPQEE